jgi:superfamily II DNA or RNA helicase
MASPAFVLPNRKAFADYITRIFLKYRKEDRDPLDVEDKDVDLCLKQTNARELFPYQKLIRDYLMIETPYRGILLYHGLGSGKTCTSIAVAESLMSYKKVWVLTPASLQQNYRSELRKCGDPIYSFEQHWREKSLNDQSRAEAKALSISDGFLDRTGKFFITVAGETPNYKDLPKTAQDTIKAQIEDIIGQRFKFINYNGLNSENIKKIVPKDEDNPFNNSVVIIDEVHNLISRIVNSSDIARQLYEAVYTAVDCKIVGLSGTPVINRPNEIAYLMNLLRGPIERITIPFGKATSWDEEKMKSAFRALPDVDTIEFNAVKKYVLVTRNPPNFRSIYNDSGERIAVQYKKDVAFIPLAMDWVRSWEKKMTGEIGAEIAVDRVTTENLECLPTKFEEFSNLFLDGLNLKNPLLFSKRIQGLVSYFKGADERLLPKRVDDDKMLEKVNMSPEQFVQYLDVRFQEIKQDAKKALSMNDDGGSYRVISRLACNYAVPPELKAITKKVEKTYNDVVKEDDVPDKPEILAAMKAQPAKYLSTKALESYSPKLLRMLTNVEATRTSQPDWPNQFIYSQYRQLEGLGVFAAILDANGWQPYKITNKNGQWQEDEMQDKPAYAFFSGEEKEDQRELMRQILNNRYEDSFPPSLKTSIEKRGKKLLCLLMATSSGAEGITLANVRHVHIMEPHWTPARHDQVIGRAIRICSHATLPLDQRTVRVSFYITVISPAQSKGVEGPNVVAVRKSDVELKRYEGDPAVETFMSTDEYLYEKVYEKDRVNQRISILLKQSAVDCEIHRKLHSREKPQISCMRFDSTSRGEDLAFKPSIKSDDLDETYLRNMTRKKRRLQKLKIKDIVYFMDPDSKEIFDGQAFEDTQRLLRIGVKISDTQIKYWLE